MQVLLAEVKLGTRADAAKWTCHRFILSPRRLCKSSLHGMHSFAILPVLGLLQHL